MTATLAQAPPKRGNGLHFQRTLENIVRVRPRYPIDTWTIDDAAAFWLPNYDHTKANALSSSLIAALATRFVARCVYQHPKFSRFIQCYKKHPHVLTAERLANPSLNGLMNRFLQATDVDLSVLPRPATSYSALAEDASYYMAKNQRGYCNRTTCKHTESWLAGCLPESSFDTMRQANQLVPWASVEWGGFACWFPIFRNSLDTPYIPIRRARSHIVEKVVTRDVADAIRAFHNAMPYHLLQVQKHIAISSSLGREFMSHVEALEGEKLRYYGMVLHHPNCDQLIRRWDDTFAASCWMFGKRDAVYADFTESYWDLEWDKFCAISENQMNGLFPVIPDPITP